MKISFQHIIITFILFYSSITPVHSENTDFSVGIIIPLSGALAEYGTAIRNGFELAKIESPHHFTSINYIYEDSGYDANTAITALNSLKSTEKIDLYYMWGVSPTEAMLPIADRNNLAVIAETTIKEATIDKKYVVRAARTGERIAKALTNEIKRRKLHRVSLIVSQIPFYTDIVQHLEKELELNGIQLTKVQDVLPTEMDFRTYILKLKQNKNDSVGLFLLPTQLISFYKQLEQNRLNIKTFNADLLDSSTIVKKCPESIDGAFFSQVGITSDFRKRYINYSKSDIHIGSAAQSFDVANLIGELFGNLQKKLTSEEIIKTISEIPLRFGATGEFEFTNTKASGMELRMPVSMKMVKDGNIEIISEDTGY
jgi:ABC-type branched-subunit amino acid transport system substrate-binding protein